MLVGHY